MNGSRLLHMNPAIGKPFEGLDVDGRHVAGVVLHSGKCDKATQRLETWVIQCYPQNGRRHGGYAIVAAQAIKEHLEGLALLASMGTDKE